MLLDWGAVPEAPLSLGLRSVGAQSRGASNLLGPADTPLAASSAGTSGISLLPLQPSDASSRRGGGGGQHFVFDDAAAAASGVLAGAADYGRLA